MRWRLKRICKGWRGCSRARKRDLGKEKICCFVEGNQDGMKDYGTFMWVEELYMGVRAVGGIEGVEISPALEHP